MVFVMGGGAVTEIGLMDGELNDGCTAARQDKIVHREPCHIQDPIIIGVMIFRKGFMNRV